MFRHVALFRFSPESTHEQRQAVVDALATLPGVIDAIRDYHVGLDHGLDNTNWHMAVAAAFDDEAGYHRYRDDPTHRQVAAEHVHPILAERAAVQFEA